MVEVGDHPKGSAVVLWVPSPGLHVHLHRLNKLGEHLAPCSGSENDVGGKIGCAMSEYAFSSRLMEGAFTNDVD
jgi:hypothetical protein